MESDNKRSDFFKTEEHEIDARDEEEKTLDALYKLLCQLKNDDDEDDEYVRQSKKQKVSQLEAESVNKKIEEFILDSQTLKIKTYFNFSSEERSIYALSDIHADIHALIIVLEDLAEVIEKIKPENNNLEDLLLLDLNDPKDHDKYMDNKNLNYKWKDNCNSYIVIVGDIIDGYRKGISTIPKLLKKKDDRVYFEHEYPQIELKILLFINVLISQAITNNGYIFKLLGNHEVMNIINADNYKEYYDYIFPNDKECAYYNNIYRKDFFSPSHNNAGFDLLMQYGCWCLLVINDYIFVHGQINYLSYSSCKFINQILNNKSKIKKFCDIVYKILNDKDGILWDRTFGDAKKISVDTCTLLEKAFSFFYSGDNEDEKKESVKDNLPEYTTFKLVIGHCQQFKSSHENLSNTTYVDVIDDDDDNDKRISYSGEGMTGNSLMHDNLIFGISMQCQTQEDRNKYKLYRVDVGASRSFDITTDIYRLLDNSQDDLSKTYKRLLTHEEKQKILYYSRTPSVLLIKNPTTANSNSIIKSTLRNTVHKQPRLELNKKINTYKDRANNRINELNKSKLKLEVIIININKHIEYIKKNFTSFDEYIQQKKRQITNYKYSPADLEAKADFEAKKKSINYLDQFESLDQYIEELNCGTNGINELTKQINLIDKNLVLKEKELFELNELTVINIKSNPNFNYDDSVFNKYLKYKNKYFQLKKILLNYI